jgi:RimJ/RimL family protein N-acetyltransferase
MQLDTQRLVLRPWRLQHPGDLDDLTALNSEPAVNEWLGGPSLPVRAAEALRLMQERFGASGWGVLRLEDKAGNFLGLAGLQPVRASVPFAPATEAVWRLRHAAWGHAYVVEAMTAIMAAAQEAGAPTDIVAIVATANARSLRTAERLGFKHNPARDFLHPDLENGHLLRPHRVFESPFNIVE